MRNLFDYKNFDVFLGTPFGKYLLEGLDDNEKIRKQGISKVSEYITVNKTYHQAIKRAKLDLSRTNSRKRVAMMPEEDEHKPDPDRPSRYKARLYEHYDKLYEDTRLSLEETRKIQKTCKEELAKLQYDVKTRKASTFDQICRQIDEQGPP